MRDIGLKQLGVGVAFSKQMCVSMRSGKELCGQRYQLGMIWKGGGTVCDTRHTLAAEIHKTGFMDFC